MMLDSMQILNDLIDEFGEGEVLLLSYDFLPGKIELRLVAKNCSVAHHFTRKEMDLVKVDVFNRIYKQMFTMLKKEVSLYGPD